jgi:hypothetical protein
MNMLARRVVAMAAIIGDAQGGRQAINDTALMAAIARPSLTLGGAIGHVSSVLGGSGSLAANGDCESNPE